MGRVDNKVVVITGGARGIGKATCLLLAREGARVMVTDIIEREGQDVAEAIRQAGGAADFWHLNVAVEREVADVFKGIGAKYGGVDVLVNNAGIDGPNKPTHEITEEEWDRLMSVNLKGVFFCTKHAIPLMKKRGGGSIINISSIYGIVGAADVPPYHASKGAVRLLTKTDAMFYAPDRIRVNSVHPGFILTPLVEKFVQSQPNPEAALKAFAALHPIGHSGEPDDVAYGILYLASEESKFVTGSELVIDGGYTAR